MPKLLPEFLTTDTALFAMRAVSSFVTERFSFKTFHVVMLVPAMNCEPGLYPNYPLSPHMLAEYTHGDKATWGNHDFANIAQCKALQAWHGRSDGGSDNLAHTLFPGDTPFWGSVYRELIATACSGVQPHYDRMIASMTTDMCIAIARGEKELWMKAHPRFDFLPE